MEQDKGMKQAFIAKLSMQALALEMYANYSAPVIGLVQ